MTSPAPADRRAARPLSLRQEYEEFILQRIEDYKDQLSRENLLALADDAVRELETDPEGQLVLTEVLMLEHVDRLIMRRLKLPTFRRWKHRHVRLRRAQREPTHWGLPPTTPLPSLAQRLEADELALIVGCAAAPSGFFLAAHDAQVLVIGQDLHGIEAIESRAATEALASKLQAMVVQLGHWFPDITPSLVVLDVASLTALDAPSRLALLTTLQDRTVRGGVHLILPAGAPPPNVHALAPEALQSRYRNWIGERAPRGQVRWFLASKP